MSMPCFLKRFPRNENSVIQLLGRLAIIALLLYAGVSFWYGRTEKQLHNMVTTGKAQPAAVVKPKKGKPQPLEKTDYGIIITRNIFKSLLEPTGKPIGSEEADLDSLAETTMQLALLGTVSGSKEDARAIIREEKSKKEEIYQVGSEVQGALITRIDRGKVVLQVNGREEVLNIKEPESGAPAAGGAEPVPVPAPAAGEPAENQTPQASPDDNPDRHVPEALPRRRINFRSNAPAEQPEASQMPQAAAGQSGTPAAPPNEPPAPAPSGNANAPPAQ